MSANISFNPAITTVAGGSFNVSASGLVQGAAYNDPAVRYFLAGGTLASTETLPMWGGVGIFENITPAGSNNNLGNSVGRATALTGTSALTGFSVFDQASNWVTSPQSECPSAGVGAMIPFYRLGSGARIAVAIDPALVSLDGGLITQQVSWDFASQRLVAYAPAYNNIAITAISWSAGVVTVTTAANTLVTGDTVNITGNVPTGYNGDFVITVLSTTQFTYALATNPGANTTLGQINQGGGALNVRVLQIEIGNSMIVNYDVVNNLVHWNRTGSTAIILI